MASMPAEVWLTIFDLASVYELSDSVQFVNKTFYHLLDGPLYWSRRWTSYVDLVAASLSMTRGRKKVDPLHLSVCIAPFSQSWNPTGPTISLIAIVQVALSNGPSNKNIPDAPSTPILAGGDTNSTDVEDSHHHKSSFVFSSLVHSHEGKPCHYLDHPSTSSCSSSENEDGEDGATKSNEKKKKKKVYRIREHDHYFYALRYFGQDEGLKELKLRGCYKLQKFTYGKQGPADVSHDVTCQRYQAWVRSYKEALQSAFVACAFPLNHDRRNLLIHEASYGLLVPCFHLQSDTTWSEKYEDVLVEESLEGGGGAFQGKAMLLVSGDEVPHEEKEYVQSATTVPQNNVSNTVSSTSPGAANQNGATVSNSQGREGASPSGAGDVNTTTFLNAPPSKKAAIHGTASTLVPFYSFDHLQLYHFLLFHCFITDIHEQFWDEEEKIAICSRVISPSAGSVELRWFFSEWQGSYPRVFSRLVYTPSSMQRDQLQDQFSINPNLPILFSVGYGRVEVDIRPQINSENLAEVASLLDLPAQFPLELLWNVLMVASGGYHRLAAHSEMFHMYWSSTLADAMLVKSDQKILKKKKNE